MPIQAFSARTIALAGAIGIALIPAVARGEERCLFNLSDEPQEGYYVLGSYVVPQSNIVAFADCAKTAAEVRALLAEQSRAREQRESRQRRSKW